MSRILLLAAELGGIGGVERLVASLSTLLSARHEVHVASFDPPGTTPGFPLAVPFHALGAGPVRPPALRPLTYAVQVRRLRDLERALGVDVTISNLWRADLVSVLAGMRGGATRRIALAHINVVENPTNRLMLRLRPLVAATYRRLDRFVTVSEALARELAPLYRLDPARVRTIWNPIAPPVPPMPRTGGKRVLWCGRMVPEKNLPVLVDIFAAVRVRHPAAVLHLVGDGPERGAVVARAAACRLPVGAPGSDSAIVVHGRLTDPAAVIAGADILALPSVAEGFGLVLVEAMAQGVPVAAADCASGGVHEVLAARSPHDPARRDGEEVSSGWLLPVPRDPDSLSRWVDAMDGMLGDDAQHATFRRGALARAADFAPDAIAPHWHALIAELTA